jgi:hypothetical protein
MRTLVFLLPLLPALLLMAAIPKRAKGQRRVPQWSPLEIAFTAAQRYPNPYTDVELCVDFSGPQGQTIRRPAFWDGGNTWRVRFAPPVAEGTWTWRSVCSVATDAGLQNQEGAFASVPNRSSNRLIRAGLLRMSPGRRNVVHADGSPFLLAGDTAWSLPWRATAETAVVYAADRQRKGFNCALLMTVQPDRNAVGLRARNVIGGFEVGFEDLPDGHLNRLNAAYFQYMDMLMAILLDHGVVPVYQPVFQGYGWKGLDTLGSSADPEEYARYCRYLVARYGAQPAIWLVSADGDGLAPCVAAGGEEIYRWDAYHQPVGIHYSPLGESHHHFRSHQDAEWLDFQLCQTGHGAQDTNKVSAMADNLPAKGAANGEPTYEGIGDPARAAGWWQGNEAWSNLTQGGTLGVFYGVAALWQWKITADEPGWPAWAADNNSWESALHLPGGVYVGLVPKALEGFDYADMVKHPELAGGALCIAKPGIFYCVYLPTGGAVTLSGLREPLPACWFDPKTGKTRAAGDTTAPEYSTSAPDEGPWVFLAGRRTEHK